jgi:hypothetical protein
MLDPTGGSYVIDQAPQGAVSNRVFPFLKGSGGRGHLAMTSPDPIRVTNGEATTIVYKVELTNSGPDKTSVQVSSSGTMSDWTVRVPSLLELKGGQTLSFPVILALPFRHEHGKTALFNVHAQAIGDLNSEASTDLGVFWTDVPQPSGHHECTSDEICGQWFHSSPFDNPLPEQADTAVPFKNMWFNGIGKDPSPSADDANIPAFFNDQFFCVFPPTNAPNCKTPPVWTASWFFPMSPQLLIGLDFDVTGTGLAKLSFVPSLADPGARVEAKLLYCDPAKQGSGGPGSFSAMQSCYQYTQLVASGVGTVALSPSTPVNIELPLKIDPWADFVPYKRGANLGLDLRVFSTVPQNTIVVPPRIEFVPKSSHMHLPLLEYHDPIDQSFEEVGVISLNPIDPFEKLVNPGKTTVFRFDLKNDDDIPHHLQIEVNGIHADWASIVGPHVHAMEPKSKTNFTIAVKVPGDAVAQERAELFVVAQSQEEAWVVALSRLRAHVVDTPEMPDEADLARETTGAGSPSLEPLAVLAAVAVAVVVARRRGPSA